MSTHAIQENLDPELNEVLRMEIGWAEVGRGLGQILLGYLIMTVGIAVGSSLVFLSLFGMPDETLRFRARLPGMGGLWALYIGLAVLALVGFFGYSFIMAGQFRCMMSSSERNGARWFMFFAICCLIMGPAFNVTAGIAGGQRYSDLRRAAELYSPNPKNPAEQYLQLTSFAVGLTYPLCFLLFLRAALCCVRARFLVLLFNLFILLAFAVVAATAVMVFEPSLLARFPPVTALLGLGWLVCVVGYFVVIFLARAAILTTVQRIRSPLEMQ